MYILLQNYFVIYFHFKVHINIFVLSYICYVFTFCVIFLIGYFEEDRKNRFTINFYIYSLSHIERFSHIECFPMTRFYWHESLFQPSLQCLLSFKLVVSVN